ncbi:exodeoxyribonuclease VII small subunit [Thermostichus vulcanus]|uniref:Exodeoxyribonuclease 7 small subunit n=1 Tax=Thermostichus vulcanus str. 'Rupite' TaxID=2813851 RepID=A0ABT0CFC2_THEVL|nr:exodeoxyribonuclease VII small subunit [Thermostichus vulcanus]MCJ2544470.1 exodeoxyribonuclease VII small subunit [Thermostichus vulcanus str. 'Rupite']
MKRRKSEDPWRYEVAIAEVETLINQIESGDLDLAEVVERFQQAAQTLKTCEAFLQEKRRQVEIIIEQLDETYPTEDLEEF